MQFNVQTPVLSIGWSNTSSRALRAVASASNGWLAAITVDSELLTMAPSGSTKTSKGSGDTLCFSDSADNVVCAGNPGIEVYSVPEGRSVATLSEESTGDAPATGAGPGSSSEAPIMAKHPTQNTFAVATGRVVRLIGLDAKVKADIGPLKSEIKGLEWAGDGRLYIQLSRHIFVASADGETVRTVQEIQEDGTIVAMAISPSASHLAASIHSPSDNQVDVHLLQKELTSDKDVVSTNLTSFHQYDDKISCLAWDHSGRFLATGDCGEATIWDVDLVKAGEVVQNVICCGHCQNTSIQRMAFSPNDSILATAGTDGQVLLFDSALFQEGTLLSPFAKIQAAPAGSQMMHLAWTSDASLVMATSSGIVASFQLAGCKSAEDVNENGSAVPIIPATPTRIAHNTPMERASSYSTGGGSGANSDNEALSASLQNSTRLEITTQVSKEGNTPSELPKLEVKTKMPPPADGPAEVPPTKEMANSKLSAESPEYTPTAAVDRTVPQIEDNHCNGTIEEEPEPSALHTQESNGSASSAPETSQPQAERQRTASAQLTQPIANPRPITRNMVRAVTTPHANNNMSGRGNAPQLRRPGNGNTLQRHQEDYMDRSHSFPQRAASFPKGSARPAIGSEGAPAATTPLSPGLLQRMQAIKENPQLGHHSPQRSQLAGWGPGPLQPMATPQHRPVHYKGMPMAHHMAPMAFAPGPPGMNAPHGFLPMMPQQALPFTMPPGGAPPGPMRSGPPGAVPVVTSTGVPNGPLTGPPAFAPGFAQGAPGMLMGGLPQGQPFIMVPAGAQPPQGWVPVVPSNWMGMYGGPMMPPPGHAISPYMAAMSSGHEFFPTAAPWPMRPGDDAGVEMSAQMRFRPAYRSLPASLGRTKLMPPMAPRPPGFAPPSHGAESRPAGTREAAEESQGSNQASETGSTTPAENQSCADSQSKAPASMKPGLATYPETGPPPAFAYPAPGAMLAPPRDLLMTEGTADAPPQPVTTLYVGNLPPTVDEQILFQTFRPFGHIPDIQVIRDKITNHSRGFAFVTFAGPHAATCAHAQLNGATMYGPYSGRALRLGASNRTSATAEE